MRLMRLSVTCAAIFLTTLLLRHSPAQACSCLSQTPEQAFESAGAVFEGRVLETQMEQGRPEGSLPRVRVRFGVVQSWKGVKSEQLWAITPSAREACGYDFQVGRSYLVYASSGGSEMTVSSCGHTKPIAEAQTELKSLGMGAVTVNPEPTAEEKKVYADPAAPRPRPAGCASCRVGAIHQDPLPAWQIWTAAAAFALFLRRKRNRG